MLIFRKLNKNKFVFHDSHVEKYQTDNDFLKEPGYYKDNDFGIRIEDVAVIVPIHTKVDTE